MARVHCKAPAPRRRHDDRQGVDGAIGLSLLEVASLAYLVREVSEADDGPGVGLREGEERRRLHLHSHQALRSHRLDRLRGLAEGRIGRPGGATQHGHPQVVQGSIDHGQGCLAGEAVRGRRQIVVARSFVAQGPLDEDEVGSRTGFRRSAEVMLIRNRQPDAESCSATSAAKEAPTSGPPAAGGAGGRRPGRARRPSARPRPPGPSGVGPRAAGCRGSTLGLFAKAMELAL